MSNKLKTILKAGSAAVFLLVCIFLPRAFLPEEALPYNVYDPGGSENVVSPVDFSRRAELFSELWTWEGKENKYALEVSKVDQSSLSLCMERRDLFLERLDFDQGASVFSAPVGERYYILSDGKGNGMNLIDYFYQWIGDWRNWLVITMDIDTQDIYYIYFSTECLKNFDQYLYLSEMVKYSLNNSVVEASIPLMADNLAETFGECTQMELLDWQENDSQSIENRVYNYVDSGGRPYSYRISGSFNFSPEFEVMLIDYKIRCQSDA